MSFFRSLFTVSSFTVISRIAGFVRDTLTASFLGAGFQADAFFVAQRLPNLFRSLFAEGAFSSAFVPLYTKEKELKGTELAQRFASEAFALLIALLIPFSVAVIIFMPAVIRLMAPGFHDEPEKFALAVEYSRITFPYLLLISITALQSGVLNANGRFAPGAIAPILLNITMISGLLLASAFNWEIGMALAYATSISGIIQALWLAYCCWRIKAHIKFVMPHMTANCKKLFKNVAPGAIGAGATQINLLMTTILASLLPTGAVSYLYYADRLNQLPLGIIGIAVATTLLPVLSKHESTGDHEKATHYMARSIEFCLVLGLPAAISLFLAAEQIIQTLFEHGAFSHEDTVLTAQALQAYAFGIPAFLLAKVFAARFFSREDTKTPVRIALISIATNIVLALLLLKPYGHVGMAAATSLATWINAILLFVKLREHKQGFVDKKLKLSSVKLLICNTVFTALLFFMLQETAPFFEKPVFKDEILGLGLVIVLCSSFYGVLLHVTGLAPLGAIRKMLKR